MSLYNCTLYSDIDHTHTVSLSYFRFVLMKYSDRGLADDRFWFNGSLELFKILFWFGNIFFILTNIGILTGHYFYHGHNFFLRVYRFSFDFYKN